jgi:hypothetical protein
MSESRLPVRFAERMFRDLQKTESVSRYVREHTADIDRLVIGGYGQLIQRFNQLEPHSDVMRIMPHSSHLKEVLNGQSVLTPELYGARDIVRGMRSAESLMLMGQDMAIGRLAVTAENQGIAIHAPSMPMGERAMAVAVGGHVLERMFFEAMKRSGIGYGFRKDELISPLVETALLMQNECARGYGEPVILYDLFVIPQDRGGIGWKTPERAEEFNRAYEQLLTAE